MRRLFFFLLSMCCGMMSAVAQSELLLNDSVYEDSVIVLPWPENVQMKLDSMVANDEMLQTSQLGLMVYDLTLLFIHLITDRQCVRHRR